MEKETYTWGKFKALLDKFPNDPAIKKACCNAKQQVRLLLAEDKAYLIGFDEEYRCRNLCHRYGINFDENGKIKFFDLPRSVEEAVYRQRERFYLREDIVKEIASQLDLDGDETLKVDEGYIEEMMDMYMDSADCNIPYNTTIENVVREGLAKWEKDGEVAR